MKSMAKAEAASGKSKEASKSERASRFLRNVHVLGALALVGAAVLLPPVAPVAVPLAEFAGLEAGALEVGRRHFAKRKKKKQQG